MLVINKNCAQMYGQQNIKKNTSNNLKFQSLAFTSCITRYFTLSHRLQLRVLYGSMNKR
jgi:hypothetical protein